MRVALFLAQELVDLALRSVRRHHLQPVALWFLILSRDDVDDVAIFELISKRYDIAIDNRPRTMVADFAVNRIRKIDRARPLRQRLDFAIGRKHIDALIK